MVRKNHFFGAAIIAANVSALCAMEWPSPEARLVQNFGINDGGRPFLGCGFSAEGAVNAVDKGDVLFRQTDEDCDAFVPTLGNWAAVAHNEMILSVYGRLGGIEVKDGSVYEGETIARAGESGWSSSEGFYFSFFDRNVRQWVNPFVFLVSIDDNIKPVIQSVKLRNQAGQLFELYNTNAVKQGQYTVIVQAVDRSGTSGGIAPFKIISSLNGIEIGRLEMEIFGARDGVLSVYRNALLPTRQVYSPVPGFEAANTTLTRGQAILDIDVQDYNRNGSVAKFKIYVE